LNQEQTVSVLIMEALFCLHLLRKGQADTMGIAMRKALLGEIEGRVSKSEKIPHSDSTFVGIQECVHERRINLQEFVLIEK